MSTAFDLTGQRALITGGATGLGLGMAKAIIAAGGDVVLCSRTEPALKEAAEALGPKASYRVYDVTETDKAEALIEDIEQNIGPISILINNAGLHLKKPAEEVSVEEFRNVLDVHLFGAHALTTAAGKKMLERGEGSVLFIASMASLFGIPKVIAYSAAKTAFLGVIRSLACEWGSRRVRVNAIAPGWIDSKMMRAAVDSDPERKNKILSRTPMGSFGDSDDIGNAAVYLSSPAAKFVTGVCLPVDGGVSVGF